MSDAIPLNQANSDGQADATILLQRANDGDSAAARELLPMVYEQLRTIAGNLFRAQSPNHTLQPTALVHEAYLKMIKAPDGTWQNRVHFFAVAATAMRQILHDRARRRAADKRGGDFRRVPMESIQEPSSGGLLNIVELDAAMDRLAEIAPRQARIVELRYLGGLTIEEASQVLGVSHGTVERDWRVARAWLRRELSDETRT
ncbi:MAG: sigma-70 family RNA polymerase sigma factor [Phycisphaerales bacterium]|nr:sigma-70 family RNA polymerase sigma factor [Phycisphaerales bacterium]MCB9857171.1 sigma-70 family RNA polymerase sigma factor [Phycisphaerales bacterium]